MISIHYWRVLFVFCLLLGSGQLWAAEIKDIRLWHAPERSRFVLDMDTAVIFKGFNLSNPGRVVLDLDNTTFSTRLPNQQDTGQFIEAIRLGKKQGGGIRMVFDIAKPVRYQIQLLKPVNNYQYRLVIDFYHQKAILPLKKNVEKSVGSDHTVQKPKRRKGDLVILIDPGHGGEDPGALGRRSKEKNVVLKIAKKLKKIIDKEKGLQAILTRKGDYYIGLRKRTQIARQQQAYLFVSIHADAFKNKKARGASVYALSQRGASSETARWLANQENSSDLVGGVSLTDKDADVAEVLLDMSMTNTVNESLSLGYEILDELKKIGAVHSKRVEQAGFAVLKSPDIPSVLVETAYITNPKEEKALNSSRHQTKLAKSILIGIKRYLEKNKIVYAH